MPEARLAGNVSAERVAEREIELELDRWTEVRTRCQPALRLISWSGTPVDVEVDPYNVVFTLSRLDSATEAKAAIDDP